MRRFLSLLVLAAAMSGVGIQAAEQPSSASFAIRGTLPWHHFLQQTETKP